MSSNNPPTDYNATIVREGADPLTVRVKGRNAWALSELVRAQPRGVTPITHPGPRWSAYVLNLRKAGFRIETLHKGHKGPYPGHHGEYRLHDTVVLDPIGQGAAQ